MSHNRHNIFTSTGTATVASSASETTIIGSGQGSLTLPGNFFAVGKSIRVSVKGAIGATGTPTLRLKVKLGSTVILDTTALTLTAITGTNAWALSADITCRSVGGSGTVFCQGAAAYFTSSTAPSGLGPVNTATSTIDTTASQALDVTAQWGTADASNTISGTNVIIQALN